MEWKNVLTEMLGIEYSIVQAPMLGVTTPEMVAAISNCGGLGSLPVGGLPPARVSELIRATKSLTRNPFAVNLFADDILRVDYDVKAMQDVLEGLGVANNILYQKELATTFQYHTYVEQLEVLVNEKVPVVSFTFGIPSDESIQKLKAAGILLIGTATSSKEAALLHEKNIDIITAQGIEAGGHRGSFLPGEPLPMVGTMALVPQIVKKTRRPVLAAGGINDGKTIKAAMVLGAAGVQIGTTFIASTESIAGEGHKKAVLTGTETDLVLTRAITGRWARGFRNQLITAIESAGIDIPPYPLQLSLTLPLRAIAQQQGNSELTSLWAGQALSQANAILPAATIFKQLITGTELAQ